MSGVIQKEKEGGQGANPNPRQPSQKWVKFILTIFRRRQYYNIILFNFWGQKPPSKENWKTGVDPEQAEKLEKTRQSGSRTESL